MRAVIRYSVYRMALFAVTVVVLYLLGADGLLLLALSLLISLGLAYVLLRGPREEVARVMAERAGRRLPPGPDADAQAEDAAIDRAAGGPESGEQRENR